MSEYPTQEENKWVTPVMDNYGMKCCDCGLIHLVDFQATKVVEVHGEDDKTHEPLSTKKYGVRFRVRRENNEFR
jgi:hypothetical protein